MTDDFADMTEAEAEQQAKDLHKTAQTYDKWGWDPQAEAAREDLAELRQEHDLPAVEELTAESEVWFGHSEDEDESVEEPTVAELEEQATKFEEMGWESNAERLQDKAEELRETRQDDTTEVRVVDLSEENERRERRIEGHKDSIKRKAAIAKGEAELRDYLGNRSDKVVRRKARTGDEYAQAEADRRELEYEEHGSE